MTIRSVFKEIADAESKASRLPTRLYYLLARFKLFSSEPLEHTNRRSLIRDNLEAFEHSRSRLLPDRTKTS